MTITVGIDSGSTATKGILLEDGVIQRRFLCPTPFRPADAARLYAAGRRAAAASARHSVLPHLRPTGPKSRSLLQQLRNQAGWVYIRLTPPKQRTTPGRFRRNRPGSFFAVSYPFTFYAAAESPNRD